MQDRTQGKAIHLPGLNGFRVIAAVAVVVSHTGLVLGSFGLGTGTKGLDLARYGVTIFFTLSGFLITYLLLKEQEKAPISIKQFYLRRVLRIWPLYYLYFALCLATIAVYHLPCDKAVIPFYIFLSANVPYIIGRPLMLVHHYWSLGVEEQFYLFFPHLARLGARRLLRISLGLIVLLMALKLLGWWFMKHTGAELLYKAIEVTKFHVMLIGVVAAILYHQQHERFMAIATHKLTQVLCWLCILLVAVNKFRFIPFVDAELISVVTACLIIGQVTKRNHIINLDNKLCDQLGRISYGMYIIHPLLLFFLARWLHFSQSTMVNYILLYTIVLTATVVTAC